MYKVYLMTGVLLLLIGIITIIYLLWLLKNKKLKFEKSIILYLSHAISTVFIGIFYIYSAITMLNNINEDNLQQIPFYFNYGQYFNLTDFNNNESSIVTEENQIQDGFEEENLNQKLYEASPVIPEILQDLNDSTPTEKINNDDPTSQFLLKYQQFLKTALNKTTYELPILKRKERIVNNDNNYKEKYDSEDSYNKRCSYENIFLQQVMLTYSFVHGLITLINSAINCKDCLQDKEININGNEEKPSTSLENSSNVEITENSKTNIKPKAENSKPQQPSRKLILQLLTMLIPPLCASSLYVTMQNQENIPTTLINQHISKILQNPTNISSPENTNQVNNVIQNIYKIITEVKASPNLIIPKFSFVNQNITSEVIKICYTPTMSLKIHTFLIFIAGYFLAMLYLQTTYTKVRLNGDSVNGRNLKMELLGFSTLWLPAALEMFTRIYLTKGSPSLLAELLTALGNFSYILMNITSVLMSKKVVKNQNYVQPVL